jgi:hypothetical protein
VISSVLSLVPSFFKWLFGNRKRATALVILGILMAGTFGGAILPVQAQTYQPEDILQEFIKRMGVEVMDWQQDESELGYTVYFASSPNAPDATNAAQVVYLQDAYGSNGGDIWVEEMVTIVEDACQVSQLTFHNFNAYTIRCAGLTSHVDMFMWSMGPWAAAAYDFFANDPDYPVNDVAEMLYTVMAEMIGAPGSQAPANLQPGSSSAPTGNLQDQATYESGDLQLAQEVLLKLIASYPDLELVSIWQDAEDAYCTYISVSARTIGSPVESNNYARIFTCPSPDMVQQKIHNQYATRASCSPEYIDFNRQKALFADCGTSGPGIHWSSGVWGFQANGPKKYDPSSGWPDYGGVYYQEFANQLYQIADSYGMISADSSLAAPFTGTSSSLGGLIPAAVLPPLTITGLSLLLELLRRSKNVPNGLVNSGIPGLDAVTPEVAAIHEELLQRGYQYDPDLRMFRQVEEKVKSPLDGSLVSRQQAEYEHQKLREGYIFDGHGFLTPDQLKQRQEHSRQSELDRVQMSKNAAAQVQQDKDRKQHAMNLRTQVGKLEAQAQADSLHAQILAQSTVQTLWSASQLTTRTVVTGVDHNGNVSFLALGGRLLTAGMTGGVSELVLNSADLGYRTHDGMQAGQSFGQAALTSAAWMGVEVGAAKGIMTIGKGAIALGGWGLKSAAGSTPVMWAGSMIRKGTSTLVDALKPAADDVLNPALKNLQQSIKQAVGSGKPSEILPEHVRPLYQNGGQKTLRDAEKLGLISPAEAKALNATITSDANTALRDATPEAMRTFEKKTGVKVTETLIGDSGSSSSRSLTPRSVNSDNDRTILASFEESGLNQKARELMASNQNLSPAQAREMAHQQLQSEFTTLHQNQVNQQLNKIGLTVDDIDYKNYSGLTGDARMGDSYPAGFNNTRMANQGDALVFRQNPNGKIVSSNASGQYLVDREALGKIQRSGAQGADAAKIIASHQPRITTQDAKGILIQQQNAAATTTDPNKLAKAILRTDKAQRIMAGSPGQSGPKPPAVPSDMIKTARNIINHPQQASGNIPPGFSQRAGMQILNIIKSIPGK